MAPWWRTVWLVCLLPLTSAQQPTSLPSAPSSTDPPSPPLPPSLNSRRWFPKAKAATVYLDGMDAPEIAEIIQQTRTGNPIYDGITSVMTVTDYGLRQRQQALEDYIESGGADSLLVPPVATSVFGEEGSGSWTLAREGSGGKKKRTEEDDEKQRDSQQRRSNRISLRKVVVDEAMNQYFNDRQWFVQEILAPVFAEEISAAVQRVVPPPVTT